MKTNLALAGIVFALLISIFSSSASATPACVFAGNVTVNGNSVAGDSVHAYLNGTGEYLATGIPGYPDGKYNLPIPEGNNGKYVIFKVENSSLPFNNTVEQGPQLCNDPDHYTIVHLTVVDGDTDGYAPPEDCNDSNPAVHPNAVEVCNGIDDNCNGQIDENACSFTYYCDADGDGHASKVVSGTCNTYNCIPSGCSTTPGDDCCDAGTESSTGCSVAVRASIHPGVEELCGGIDYNCDGITNGCGNPNPPSGPSGGGGGAYCGDGILQKYTGEECEKGIACNATGLICNTAMCKCSVCAESWSCGEWSACSQQGVQTRTCTDSNNCGTANGKPSESQACTYTGGGASSQVTPLAEVACGNGKCETGETCQTCPQDCGQCAGAGAGAATAGGSNVIGFMTSMPGLSLLGLLVIAIVLLALYFTTRKKKENK